MYCKCIILYCIVLYCIITVSSLELGRRRRYNHMVRLYICRYVLYSILFYSILFYSILFYFIESGLELGGSRIYNRLVRLYFCRDVRATQMLQDSTRSVWHRNERYVPYSPQYNSPSNRTASYILRWKRTDFSSKPFLQNENRTIFGRDMPIFVSFLIQPPQTTALPPGGSIGENTVHWSQRWPNLGQNWLKLANWLRSHIPVHMPVDQLIQSVKIYHKSSLCYGSRGYWWHSLSYMHLVHLFNRYTLYSPMVAM